MEGGEAGGRTEERRCPSCGALVGPGAEWCGQCFATLPAAPEPTGPGSTQGVGPPAFAAPVWPCPLCRHRNPIEADVCEVCDTPFGRLFEEERRSEVSPRTALVRSLLFPGAGHAAAGRSGEGLLRGVLFAWTLGMAAMFLSAWRGAGAVLAGLYGAAAAVIYVLSALEARRLAEGDEPLLPPRALLWGSVALVAASGLLAALTIVGAADR